MATFEYSVDGQSITTTKAGRLVSGTIGVNTVKFTFDSSWDGLEKWATFDPNPGKPYKQPLDANGECLIPGEVMGGITLRIGAFGLADGQAYPTVWANKLQMEEGCFIEVPVSDWPEPSPVIEEILEELENKVDKPEDATPGNVAIIGSNNNIVDGGFKATESFPVGSASGAVASLSDGAKNVPIKSTTVDIQPVQASGTPSPSNVLPISGWTGVELQRTAKNLIDPNAMLNTGSGTSDRVNRTVTSGATASSVPYLALITPSNKFKANTAYTLILDYTNTGTRNGFAFHYTDGAETVLQGGTVSTRTKIAFTSNASKTLAYIGRTSYSGTKVFWVDGCGLFEGVLTASDFESYNGNTYTIEFPSEAGTVYGGELTVNEDGTGTLTKTMDIVKVGDITWTKSGDYFRSNAKNSVIEINSPAYCSMYPVDFEAPISDGYIGVGLRAVSSSYYLMVRDSSRSSMTASEWKTAFSDMEIVYTLKTPVVYQLTASQVSTLLGLNNIWADTGDIAVEYHADPTIYVEEKIRAIKESIAPIEDGYTASQAYISGRLFYVQDQLYQATTAISSGATITPGTNCRAVTVADIIFYILDDLQ